MHTHEPRGLRSDALRRTAAAWVVGLTLILAGAPLWAAGTERIELRGAQASEVVVPLSLDVDLRDLPAPAEWQPGDPIKEIPRRHQRPIKGIVDPPEGEVIDPLLELQDIPSPVLDEPNISLNFAGQGYTGVNPSDPNGDVGPNHYIQAINQSSGSRITVYSKTGTVLSGPFTLASLGGTGACATGLGDPVVLYDPLADRWMLSEFASSGNHLCVYVSQTSNPVGGGWYFYDFTTPTFPDYPKYGVWPDAYYVGTNEGTPAVYALDRVRMLAGQPATSQRFTATALSGFGFQMLTPADVDGVAPPAGAPGVFIRHRDSEAHGAPGAADTLELFNFSVNWSNPALSTFTGPTSITVTEFDSALCGLTSFNCFPQPGSSTTLDPLREVVMFRAQYRNRGSFESLVGNLVTDVTGTDRGGIRWFELRKSGASPWSLYMEGTYSPDTTHRWMGSAAVDKDGNLVVGYSVSASTVVYPGLRFAGRLAGDPAGALSQGETLLVAGAAANASNRWGDYASMSVDPADDCTFWFTGQYSPATSWGTRIGAFKFTSCGGAPTPDFSVSVSPASLSVAQCASASTTVTVTSINGWTNPVTLSASGLPAGVTASFVPNPVTPTGNSTLTLTAAAGAATGTFTVTITGTSGTTTHTTTLTLTVTAGSCCTSATAVYDSVLRAPKCGAVGTACDSGPTLLLGRDTMAGGAEPNQPNTINNTCADGTAGSFHVDESNDRLKVSTLDCTPFAPGKTVRVEATVWAWNTGTSDAVDLYYAADATAPAWTYITTLVPTAGGAQVLSATYTLPAGSLQAVRAVFRYLGAASSCSAGSYDDADDLVFAVGGGVTDQFAAYDAALRAPKCAVVGKSCDSGATLLLGRGTMSGGAEPNQPNTINASCADGTSGTFHSDESNDRLKVLTLSGGALAAGQTVRVEATVWAWTSSPGSDALDLYYAANATAPVWTYITTLIPTVGGAQVLSANYTLPAGTLQAVRAAFRYGGAASSCTTGVFDDRDDLIFAVQ